MQTTQPGNKKLIVFLYIILYATMFLFGLVENIKGVSFPLIKSEFGVEYDSQGGLVSLTWFGYVTFCLIASLFLQRFGIKKALLAGYLAVILGAIATLTAPSFWIASLTLFIVNAGFGFFEIGANALGTVVFTSRAAMMMNLLHLFYGMGAILGPKAAGLFTDTFDLSWRWVYIAMILPAAAVFLFTFSTPFHGRTNHTAGADAPGKITFFKALKNPLVWLFCLALGCMEVVEFGAANWGGLYLQDVYGLDPRVVGASFVSLFYIQFTLSRLFSGWFIEKAGYLRSLYFAMAGIAVIYLVGFALGPNGIWILPTTGLLIAITFPTMMAVVMQVFGDDAPAMTGVIITLSGAVNGIVQFLIGLTNQYIGEAWGYRSCLLYAVLAIVLLTLLINRVKQTRQTLAPAAAPSQD